MKLLAVVFFFGLTYAGPLDNKYLPPNSARTPTVSIEQSPVYGPVNNHQKFSNTGPEFHSNILHFDNDNDGTGNYQYQYETDNKITQQERGQLKQGGDGGVTVVQGSYSYIGDDGKTYTVNYVADENGFQPVGEHIDQTISRTAAEAARSAVPDLHQHGYGGQNVGYQTGESGFSQNSNRGYRY